MAIPEPQKAMQECNRILTPGGLLALTTWQYVGWYPDAVAAFATNPKLPPLPPLEDFVRGFSKSKERWDRPQFVREHFEANGFENVQTDAIPGQTSLTAEEANIMSPGMLGVIYHTLWNQEQRDSLSGEAKETLIQYLKQKYGDGPIVWDWVAICAWGRKRA